MMPAKPAANAVRIPEFEISSINPEMSFIGEVIELTFIIRNLGSWEIPIGEIMIQDNGYFSRSSSPVPFIPAYQTQVVNILTYVRQGATILDVNQTYTIDYHGKSKAFTFATLTTFSKGLTTFRPCQVDMFNILFFGISRTGKSSFINKVLTLLDPVREDERLLRDVAPVGSGEDRHVTLELKRFAIPSVRIALWDTWGVGPDNYLDGTLLKLLDGELPTKGFTVDTRMDQQTSAALEAARDTRIQRRIHACVVCITPEWVEMLINGQGEVVSYKDGRKYPMKNVKEIVIDLFLKMRHLNPLVVIHKADKIGGPQSRNVTAEPPPVVQVRTRAAELLRVPLSSVYSNVNYTQERMRDWNLDKMTYLIMRDAITRARDFEEKYARIAETRVDGTATGFSFD